MPRNAAGQFVSKESLALEEAAKAEAPTARELELEAELAALRAATPEPDVEGPAEPSDEDIAIEPLVLQSKFTQHTVSIVPTRRVYHPVSGMIEPVPGLFAQFTGPQRIFDSLVEQEKWGWTDEQRELIEEKLVSGAAYMKDYFPAPLKQIPDRLVDKVRVKEAPRTKFCMAFGYHDGNLVQCGKPATAGRDFCQEHDPNVTKIVKSGGTTVG